MIAIANIIAINAADNTLSIKELQIIIPATPDTVAIMIMPTYNDNDINLFLILYLH
jgi:hypothetical protein